MPSITNRSRYIVSVKNSPDCTKEFGFRRVEDAVAYLNGLKKKYKSAELTRADDCFLVRFRQPGQKPHSRHVKSRQEAEELIEFAETNSSIETPQSFVIGSVTFAELADLYIKEVCPIHKGGRVEAYTLSSMLRDAGYASHLEVQRQEARNKQRLASEEKKRQAALRPKNKNMARPKKKMEAPESEKKKAPRKRGHVRWMTKSICDITGEEIQRFVNANTGVLTTDETDVAGGTSTVVSPATVDRELDVPPHLSSSMV